MRAPVKELMQPVYMRIKQSNHDWLRSEALAQDRPVTWIVNKLIERAKDLQETPHEKQV